MRFWTSIQPYPTPQGTQKQTKSLNSKQVKNKQKEVKLLKETFWLDFILRITLLKLLFFFNVIIMFVHIINLKWFI